MKYSGSSIVTSRQVGASAVVIENDSVYETTITKTKSTKNGSDAVVVYYMVAAFPNKWFLSTEVFDNAAAGKAAMDTIS